MTRPSDRPRRRSLRLRDYDYTQAGAYFVTVCTQDRACLFGEVVDGEMRLNEAGETVETWWLELNNKFPTVQTDEYVIMPNHVHGIVSIIAADPVGADLRVCPGAEQKGAHTGAPLRQVSVADIVQWFKTMSTNAYIRGVKMAAWPAFRGRLWQRNYYEHIIRDAASLHGIREYIVNNPLQWALDRENPTNLGAVPRVHPGSEPVGADLRVCAGTEQKGAHTGAPLRGASRPWEGI